MDKLSSLTLKTLGLFAIEFIAIVVLSLIHVINNFWIALGLFSLSLYFFIFYLIKESETKSNRLKAASDLVDKNTKKALDYGKIGLITYDEKFDITWMSDFFTERNIDFVGKKCTKWISDISKIFQGDLDELKTEYKGKYYSIVSYPESSMLFVKDITDERNLQLKCDNEEVVLGLVHYDNYEEATRYEEETVVSIIDTEVKTPVMNWANNYGIIIKRLKRDRYLLVLNKETFEEVKRENFSILDTIREAAKDYPIPITLSMAFAYGNNNFSELDEMLYSLLELAQGRGGDQVAMREYGQDTKFFGGNTEAQENRNKMRVKVIAKTIRELVTASNKVLIVGHKEADFDCLGSALGLSRIIQTYNKNVYVVFEKNNLEATLSRTFTKYKDEIEERHNLVSIDKAMTMLDNDTLVFMVDHHDITQTMAENIIKSANKIAIIDHHRRKGDFTFNPTMVYMEPGASSVSELITELATQQVDSVGVSEKEATIMYTGILIDTNNFKVRVGSRTFEAAAELRKYGADPMESFELLKEDFAAFEIKTHVLNNCEKVGDNMIIASCSDYKLTRSLMSQVANDILEIKDVAASFVICKLDDTVSAISARSDGTINVQVILEQMHGGGHFSQAGLQRENVTVEDLKKELLSIIG